MVSRLSSLVLMCIFGHGASILADKPSTVLTQKRSMRGDPLLDGTDSGPAELQHPDVYDEDFPSDSHKKTPTEVRMEQAKKGQPQQTPRSAGAHPQAFLAVGFTGLVAALY